MSDLQLAGRTAVITGAARGIGAAIARRLRRDGANVAIVDPAAEDPAVFLATPGPGEVLLCQADVADPKAVDDSIDAILGRFGRAEIFVGNAGGSGAAYARTIEEVTDEVWNYVMDVNLTSVVRYCRRLAPGMREAKHGRIICISSGARFGLSYPIAPTIRVPLAYATAKEAMAGLVRQLAKDLGPDGITANAVSPGMILTDENSPVTQLMRENPEVVRDIVKNIPIGRPGRGDDIASVVAFLASPDAEFLSGEIFEVRGG